MIRSQDLAKAFGNVQALKGVSLQVGKKEIFGLVGPDGAGKTTLIRILCGLISPDQGRVWLMDKPVKDLAKKELGYMPQHFSLYPELSVMENINFFGSMYGLNRGLIQERADTILELTGLSPFKKRLADQLSGGMKQKLSLTCSLITRPSILMLDEPTYGVDPQSRKEFWGILYHLNQEGMTILLSTPYMDEAELCHRVGIINDGNLLAIDSPDNLKAGFPYTILEVRAEVKNPHFFSGVPEVVDSSFFGYKYHLLIKDREAGCQAINEHLARQRVALHTIKPVPPSMEDIFIALVKN
ncbi:MAG: ABC transporter ATP-binding protein [Syntrophomonadaceae bacterium]